MTHEVSLQLLVSSFSHPKKRYSAVGTRRIFNILTSASLTHSRHLHRTPTMSFAIKKPFLLVLLLFSAAAAASSSNVQASVGVTYAIPASAAFRRPPPPDHVAAALQSLKIGAVRLPDADPSVVRAFSYSNTSLLLTVPNALVPALAANRSNAFRWLYRHVVPFYPRARIATISVGNDPLSSASDDAASAVLPAIRNLHAALADLGIRKIAVSTTFSFINIMTTAFPPSAAEFEEPMAGLLIKPLLKFLKETNSSFLVNLYPYNVYRLRSEIPIGFALFQESRFNFRDDLTTGVRYRNLFDMMVDAVICAMAVAGHENVPVVVTETGWPSAGGDESEVADASAAYAEMYLEGLVRHIRAGQGTPLRREGVEQTFIYELFDREATSGATSESVGRQWGILYPNLTRKYSLQFSGASPAAALGWCSSLSSSSSSLMLAVAFSLISCCWDPLAAFF